MKMSKDTAGDEKAAAEMTNTARLAVQAFDGHQLSEGELESLCDAAFPKPVCVVAKL